MLRIPQSELEIMKVIWSNNEPVSSKVVTTELENIKGWKRTTTLTLLSRLTDKGFLEADRTKRLTYYTSLVNKKDYINFTVKNFVKDVFDKEIENENIKEIIKIIKG